MSLLARLIDAGLPSDLVAEVAMTLARAEAAQEAVAAFRENDAARTRRYRQRGGGEVPPQVRQDIFERDGHQCLECGSLDRLEIDHIIPLNKGGDPTHKDNLQTLCRPCNARKRDRIRKEDNRGKLRNPELSVSTPTPSSPLEPPNTPTPVKNNTPRVRKGRFPAPEGVSEEQWEAFCSQRKKPLNDHSYRLLWGKLARFAEDGWPPGDLIDRAIEHGWETVFEPKDYSNGRSKQVGSVGGNKPDPFAAYRAEIAADLAAEEAASGNPGATGGHGGALPPH